MTDTNPGGWPEKPGVPLHPERDGDHIIRTLLGVRVVTFWRATAQSFIGVDGSPYKAGSRCTYLGPCHTPAEVAALKAERDEAKAMVSDLSAMNTLAIQQRIAAEAERDRMRAGRDHFGSTADARAVCITMLERKRDRQGEALRRIAYDDRVGDEAINLDDTPRAIARAALEETGHD